MTQEITLETLLPYTDFMTDVELLRFTDYLGNREPFAPFTHEEIEALEERKERYFHQQEIQEEKFKNYLQEAWNYIKERIISTKK